MRAFLRGLADLVDLQAQRFIRRSQCAGQAGPVDIVQPAALQTHRSEARRRKIGPRQIGAAQIHVVEHRPGQIDAAQIRAAQIDLFEERITQIRAGEVRMPGVAGQQHGVIQITSEDPAPYQVATFQEQTAGPHTHPLDIHQVHALE